MSENPQEPSSPAARPESLDPAILRMLMDSIPDTLYFKDLESRFVWINCAQAVMLGVAKPEDALGKTDADYFEPAHADVALAEEREIIRTGQPLLSKVERILNRDGRKFWCSTTKLPWRDTSGHIIGTFGLTRDITASKLAEEKLLESRNLLQTIIDHIPSFIFVKDLAGRYFVNNLAHRKLLGVDKQEEALGRTVLDFFPGATGWNAAADDSQVLGGGQSILNREESDYGQQGLTRCLLTTKVPLRDVEGNIHGLIGISHDITERKRTDEELHRRTDEMEADVRMARQLQESFFPREYPVFPRSANPAASTLHFAHRYVSAATLGGDFFDIIQLSDNQCAVLVCDVMGHGVRAGLLTALIRGVVKEIGHNASFPAHVLGEINHSLAPILEQTGQPHFATVFFGIIDTAAGKLVFGNAGHPPPLVFQRATGRVVRLVIPNPEPAAGLVDGFGYSQCEIAFAPGDLLVSYTDGLFEACDAADNAFGEDRLSVEIARHAALPVGQLVDQVVSAVQTFTGHVEFEDDVCIVAVARADSATPN
ncbi:MAG: SpoIIE family protein phosphatase [Opitutae bacterium]|nr:SpoIIE family protein phosphatase [Opitutae bacterium]